MQSTSSKILAAMAVGLTVVSAGAPQGPDYEKWSCEKCNSAPDYQYCKWDGPTIGCLPKKGDGHHIPCGQEAGDVKIGKCPSGDWTSLAHRLLSKEQLERFAVAVGDESAEMLRTLPNPGTLPPTTTPTEESGILNGKEYCESDSMIHNEEGCKASQCCQWSLTKGEGAFNPNASGRCWSNIGDAICIGETPGCASWCGTGATIDAHCTAYPKDCGSCPRCPNAAPEGCTEIFYDCMKQCKNKACGGKCRLIKRQCDSEWFCKSGVVGTHFKDKFCCPSGCEQCGGPQDRWCKTAGDKCCIRDIIESGRICKTKEDVFCKRA